MCYQNENHGWGGYFFCLRLLMYPLLYYLSPQLWVVNKKVRRVYTKHLHLSSRFKKLFKKVHLLRGGTQHLLLFHRKTRVGHPSFTGVSALMVADREGTGRTLHH